MNKILILIIPYLVLLYSQPTPLILITPTYQTNSVDYAPNVFKNFKLNICNTSIYSGCGFNVTYNVPFEYVDPDMGIFIQFYVFGSTDDCTTIICQNNPNFVSTWVSCAFTYDPLVHGNAIYIYTQSGNSDDLKTVTWNVGVTCSGSAISDNKIEKFSKARKMVDVFPALVGECDMDATIIPERFKSVVTGEVKSSNDFNNNDRYYFQICGDGVTNKNLTTFVQGSDLNGAYTTYICPSLFVENNNCYPRASPSGFNNPIPTAFNDVYTQLTTPEDLIYLTVRGAGKFNSNSDYVLNVIAN